MLNFEGHHIKKEERRKERQKKRHQREKPLTFAHPSPF